MSWKWFERVMYSLLGVSSATAVSGLVALAILDRRSTANVVAKCCARAPGCTQTGERAR